MAVRAASFGFWLVASIGLCAGGGMYASRFAGFQSIPNAKLFLYEEHPEEVAHIIGGFLATAPR